MTEVGSKPNDEVARARSVPFVHSSVPLGKEHLTAACNFENLTAYMTWPAPQSFVCQSPAIRESILYFHT